MTPERWQRIKEIALEAMDLPTAERAAYIQSKCSGDSELQQSVERMMREDTQTSNTLERAVSAAAMDLQSDSSIPGNLIGQTVSHYRIIEKLGEGGMGVVYKAEDENLHRSVALKFLRTGGGDEGQLKGRFIKEAEAAAALDHPNITTIYEVGKDGGLIFIAMAFEDGKTLAEKIRERPLPLAEAFGIAIQVAEGLRAAHERGVVHRDIKPGNIMITPNGRVKVMDFGLAHLAGQTRMTRAGTIMGTPAYMSPEQTRGDSVDHRSDVWSLGVVLYEMVTGRLPFHGETAQTVALSIQNETPEPLTALRTGIPRELDRIVGKAMAKKPGERYQRIEEMLIDLGVLDKQVRGDSRPEHDFRDQKGRRLTPLLAGAVAVLIVGVTFGWWVWGPPVGENTGHVEASVAVMPFIHRSADADNEYFSDGMTDELINALSRVAGMKVAARSSVFRYKGKEYDVKEVGGQLGVGTVLEGTVRKAGTRLRVSVQLTSVSDGFNLWSQTYDREIQDIFDVQEEVCRAMVEALQVHMGRGSEQPLVERYTDNWEAYDFYLRGRYHHWRTTEADFKASLRYFERAKELDPRYPLPYVGIAANYSSLGHSGIAPPRESLARAERELDQAMAINSTIPLAYSNLGYIRRGQLRWQEAETACKRAIELDPRLAHGYKIYGQILGEMGRTNEAIAMAKKAVELEPATGNNRYSLGMVFLDAGQYDEAIEEARSAIELDADNILGYWLLGAALVEQDRFEEAIESFEQARRVAPNLAFLSAFVGYVYGRAGKREQAQGILSELLERRKNEYVPSTLIAIVQAGLGDDGAMFHWLDTAYRDGDPALGFLKTGPWYAPYRSDPRFQDLENRVGFPEEGAPGGG